jgi:MFS family permease
MHGHHGTAVQADVHTDTRPWGPMLVALVAQVFVVIDISVVNTAMPTIGHELGLASSDLQWVVTAYLLMSGRFLLLGGRIADLVSRRSVFLTGLTLFTAASLSTGFAGGAAELIAGRAAQGAAAALMTPAALSIISTTYTGKQKTRGLALWGAIGGLGIAVGVALGGVLTTWASWEAIFWINVPIGVIAIAATLHVVEKDPKASTSLGQFDVPGAVVGVGALATLMFTLARVETEGWASVPTVVGLGLAGCLMAAFVLVERRAAQPLVHPHTWKISSLVSSTTVMLGITGLLMAVVFLTSIFGQTALGYSALESGPAFLPLAVTLVVGTHVAAHGSAHLPARTIAAVGLAVVAAGGLLLSRADETSSYPGALAIAVTAVAFAAVAAVWMPAGKADAAHMHLH